MKAAEYRKYAAECRKLAARCAEADKPILLEIAAAWEQCAVQAERKSGAVDGNEGTYDGVSTAK